MNREQKEAKRMKKLSILGIINHRFEAVRAILKARALHLFYNLMFI